MFIRNSPASLQAKLYMKTLIGFMKKVKSMANYSTTRRSWQPFGKTFRKGKRAFFQPMDV
jgi:hypothetical protein